MGLHIFGLLGYEHSGKKGVWVLKNIGRFKVKK